MNWLDNVEVKDLPSQYKEMAGIIGIENTLKLAEHYAKEAFYFVGLEPLISALKRKYIIDNFTGNNHRELKQATKVSLAWVYQVIREDYAAKRSQPSLFDAAPEAKVVEG